MTFVTRIANMRSKLVTVLVDPAKTSSNNELVGLVEDLGSAVDLARVVPTYTLATLPATGDTSPGIIWVSDSTNQAAGTGSFAIDNGSGSWIDVTTNIAVA